MSDDYKHNIKEHSAWMRGLYIVLFTVIYSVAEIVIVLVVLLQFLSVLLTSRTNDKLLSLGMNLSTFIYQILSYVTFNSDDRPFPYSDFPAGASVAAPTASKKKPGKKKAVKKKLEKDSDDSSSDDSDKSAD